MFSHSQGDGGFVFEDVVGSLSKSLDHDRRERGVRSLLDRLVSLVRLSELSLPTTQTVSF